MVDVPRLESCLATLSEDTFDLIVVGGGITGVGVARHAAQAGLSVLVLEARDFASGTSSRSTKLIHGGLRYLAMGDVALVRESALERKSLRAMAPHLTEPRWMVVPAASLPQFAKLRVGIGLYERLGAVDTAERHRNWRRRQLEEHEPLLDRARLPWACVYREYLTDDARLVLAVLRAAVRLGARACSYARVRGVQPDGAGARVTARDELTGEERELRGRVLVNATGPWVETLLEPAAVPRLHLSKGVHAVLRHARLPVAHPVMMTAADGRPVFAIPRGAVTYLGTTDTTYGRGPEHWPEVLAGDVDYLLATANTHFRVEPLCRSDVLATWAGLRPLVNQPGKAPKEMSRRDEIWRDGAVVSIAGGKLTGFRKMAEQVMAVVADLLGRELPAPEPLAPVPGGDVPDVAALARRLACRYAVSGALAERLARLYGSEAESLLGERPTALTASVFAEEVSWAVSVEGARRLEDVLYRRLSAAWFLPEERDALLEAAGPVMAERLGWTPAALEAETAHLRRRLESELDPLAVQ